MKTVEYNLINGETLKVKYDEKAPCICCGLPVESASMGGTNLCPACDCGYKRSEKCPSYSKELSKVELPTPDLVERGGKK